MVLPLYPFSADHVAAILSHLIHHWGHINILSPSVSAPVWAALTSGLRYVQRLGARSGLLHSTRSKSASMRGPLTMPPYSGFGSVFRALYLSLKFPCTPTPPLMARGWKAATPKSWKNNQCDLGIRVQQLLGTGVLWCCYASSCRGEEVWGLSSSSLTFFMVSWPLVSQWLSWLLRVF